MFVRSQSKKRKSKHECCVERAFADKGGVALMRDYLNKVIKDQCAFRAILWMPEFSVTFQKPLLYVMKIFIFIMFVPMFTLHVF